MALGWYVFKLGGNGPSHRHLSFDSAVREAERLVGAIGGTYEILAIEATVKPVPKTALEDHRDSDPMPF